MTIIYTKEDLPVRISIFSCESVVMAEWYIEHTIATVATPREPSLRLPPPRMPPEPTGLLEVSLRSRALFIILEETYVPMLVKDEVVDDDVTPG